MPRLLLVLLPLYRPARWKTESWEFEDGRLSSGGLGGLCGRRVASSCSSPAGDGEGGLATVRCRGSFTVQIPAPAPDGLCGSSTRLAAPLASVCGDLAFFLLGGVLLMIGSGGWCGGPRPRRALPKVNLFIKQEAE